MTTPTDAEINRVISEFIGFKLECIHCGSRDFRVGCPRCPSYLYSLDMFIPVLEKLQKENHKYLELIFEERWCEVKIMSHDDKCLSWGESKRPARALAMAIYQVLKGRE